MPIKAGLGGPRPIKQQRVTQSPSSSPTPKTTSSTTSPPPDTSGPDPTRKVESRKKLGGARDTTGEAFVKGKKGAPAPSATPNGVQSGLQARQDSFTSSAKAQGVTDAQAKKLWDAGPGKTARDPVTGFQTEADRAPTVNNAIQHVESGKGQAFYVQADVKNLSGMNGALGGPRANEHMRDISRIYKDELSKVGAQADVFRGSGGKMSAVVSGPNVTQDQVDTALKNASTRTDAYARRNKLDTLPHPVTKEPGVSLEAKSTQIKPGDSVDKVEQRVSTDGPAAAPTHKVPSEKPMTLEQASRPGGTETGFQNAYESQKQGFTEQAQQAKLSTTQAEQLWNGHATTAQDGVTGMLNGNYRTPTVQNAIATVKQDPTQQAVYVEMDVANLGGLNKALGKQGADDAFRFTANTVQQELGKSVGGSVTLVRHGGDEFSAVVVGPKATPEAVNGAMQRAQGKVNEYTRQHGLDSIPHSKYPDDPSKNGTGLHFGVARVTTRDTPETLYDAADAGVVLSKLQGGH